MKKILMILTSHEDMENTDSKTGLWIGEFTDPYYEFLDQGYQVTLASPMGGEPPIDPLSKLTENITASNRRFNEDQEAQQNLRRRFRSTKSEVKNLTPFFIRAVTVPCGIWLRTERVEN